MKKTKIVSFSKTNNFAMEVTELSLGSEEIEIIMKKQKIVSNFEKLEIL